MVLSQLVSKQFRGLTWRPSELLLVTLWMLRGVMSPLSAVLHLQQSLCASQGRCSVGRAALEEGEPCHLGVLQLLPEMLLLSSLGGIGLTSQSWFAVKPES